MNGARFVSGLRSGARKLLPIMRTIGLAPASEWALRSISVASAGPENRALMRTCPGVALPPPALVFETQGHARLEMWLTSGRAAAAALVERLGPLVPAHDGEVLDWGAGVGRLLRWLPELAPHWRVTGAEPNRTATAWLARHMPAPPVVRTGAHPPLPFATARFSAVYTISVFTHVPISLQRVWIAELRRVLKPGGILVLSLHGRRARAALDPQEARALARTGIVERTGVADGSRMFATYHAEEFIREVLLEDFRILLHEQDSPVANGGQDLWICTAADQ